VIRFGCAIGNASTEYLDNQNEPACSIAAQASGDRTVRAIEVSERLAELFGFLCEGTGRSGIGVVASHFIQTLSLHERRVG